MIGLQDAGLATDNPAGREIRPRDDGHQIVHRAIGVVDHHIQRVAYLAQVMRWNGRCHRDGDPARTVDQQVGELAGKDRRLQAAFVIGRSEIDRVQFQIFEHQRRDGRHAGLGISHRRWRQTSNRTEVPLFIDQDMPHVPFLGHADQRWINDTFTVRVVVTAGIAGDFGTFDTCRPRGEVQIVHRDQNPPLRRLEPVTNVRQGAGDDDAHRVRQITAFQLVFDRHLDEHRSAVAAEPSLAIFAVFVFVLRFFWQIS